MRMWSRSGGKHPPLTSNTKHLWAHDENGSSDGLKDVVGARNLSTLGGTPACVAGPINFRARRFVRASSNFFRSTTSDAADASSLQTCTIIGCMRLASTFASDGYFLLLGDTATDFIVALVATSGKKVRLVYHDTGHTFRSYDFSPVLRLGKWYPFAVVRNNGGTSAFYLDGGLVETLPTATPAASNASAKWHVGCDVGGGFGNNFDGDIASLAVYSGAMADADIEDALAGMRMLNFQTSLYVTAEVKDGDGTYRDLSNIQRTDFLKSVQWTDDVDARMRSFTVECMRDRGDIHLGKFNDNPGNRTPFFGAPSAATYSATKELLHVSRELRIKVDRRAMDSGFAQDSVAAGAANWNVALDGMIDSVEWGGNGNKVKINGREWLGAQTIRCWMPVTSVRSNGAGTAVETVAQTLIADAKGDSPPSNYANNWGLINSTDFDIYTPISPGWNIRTYSQQPGALLDEVAKLFEQIGWLLRPLWSELDSKFRLTASEPQRLQTYPNVTVPDSFIVGQNDLKIGLEDIRNGLWVTYVPSTLSAPSFTIPTIATGTTTKAVGSAYLGPLGTYAAATSSYGGEGNRVVFRVRSDDLDASEQGSDSIALYGLQMMVLGEKVLDGVDTMAEAQSYGVAVLRDLQEPKVTRSDKVQGLPEAEINDVFKFRAGFWHTTDLQVAATNITFHSSRSGDESDLGTRGKPTGGTQRHLIREVGANAMPTPTVDNTQDEAQSGMSTRARRQLHAALQAFSPSYLSNMRTELSRIRNGDFQSRMYGEAPPDCWVMSSGRTWGILTSGSPDAAVDTTRVEGARHSVRLLTNNTPIIEGDLINVMPGTEIACEIRARTDTAASGSVVFGGTFYQADGTTVVSSSTTACIFNVDATWETKRAIVPVPGTAHLFKPTLGSANATPSNVQRYSITTAYPSFRAYRSAGLTLANKAETTLVFDNDSSARPTSWDDAGEYDPATGIFVPSQNGLYDLTAGFRATKTALAVGGSTLTGYAKMTKGGTTTVLAECSGATPVGIDSLGFNLTAHAVYLLTSDSVRVRYYTDDSTGTASTLVTGAFTSWFSGRRLHED